MTLYRQNVEDAFARLQETRSDLRYEMLVPPAKWRTSRLRRRFCQRVIMPRLIDAAIRRRAGAGERPVVHVLDPHYAHLLSTTVPSTITCHDLDALITRSRGIAKMEERNRLAALPRARAIHAISGHTARDVVKFFPEAAGQVVINYYGLAPEFRRRAVARSPLVDRLRQLAPAALVLHVGTNIERKNIPVLLEGFARAKALLPERGLKLVKAGPDPRADGFSDLIAQLGIQDDLVLLGALGTADLVDVYNLCSVFAFPSRYEGFGRPVIEAQACGLPCVLAKTSSLPEVGGNAALYHAADDSAGLANHLVALLRDTALRQKCAAAGLSNVRRFTWSAHVELIAMSCGISCHHAEVTAAASLIA